MAQHGCSPLAWESEVIFSTITTKEIEEGNLQGRWRKRLVCIMFPNYCAWTSHEFFCGYKATEQYLLCPKWEIYCREKTVHYFWWVFYANNLFAESGLLLSCLHGSVGADILIPGCWWEITGLSQDTFTAECEIFCCKGNWLFRSSSGRATKKTSVLGSHKTGWYEKQRYGWRKECRNGMSFCGLKLEWGSIVEDEWYFPNKLELLIGSTGQWNSSTL